MSLNFFKAECQYPAISEKEFGLCDDQNGAKAYPDITNPDIWIATVKNGNSIPLIFTAIDKCVLFDEDHTDRGRCDVMLTSSRHLYFVELKNEGSGWKPKAIAQLESTIIFFLENHDISLYTHRKAFACNKKHRHFQEIDNELNITFFRKYKFRLDAQAEIIIL